MVDDTINYGEILKHLENCRDDLTLLTLKGHLVAENLLESILLGLLDVSEAPKRYGKKGKMVKAMPDFYHKLMLVKAAVCQREPGPNADFLIVIEQLNDMRNQLAHNLENQADIESGVRRLIENYHRNADTNADWKNESLPVQLRKCLYGICQFLYRVRAHFFRLSHSA